MNPNESSVPLFSRPSRREILLSLIACLALTVLFTFPWRPNSLTVPTSFSLEFEHITRNDVSGWVYSLSWGAAHPDRFYDAPILNPLPTPLCIGDPRLTEGLWSIPLFRLLDPVLAWGIVIWIGFIATAWASYWAGRWLTGSRWGGAAFTVFFAFGPYRAAHVYHIETIIAPFLPLALVGLASFLEKPTRVRGLLFSGCWAAAAIESVYTGVLLFSLLPPALLWAAARHRITLRQALWPLLTAGLIAGVIMLPSAIQYLEFHRAVQLERTIFENDLSSGDLSAWISHSDALFPALSPGLMAALLGLLGLRLLQKISPELLLIGALSFILSLGTMRLLFWQLGLPPIPWATPYEWLYEFLLPFRALRAPYRHAVVAHAVLALAAGLTITRIAARGRLRQIAVVAVLAFSLFEARWFMREIVIVPERARDSCYAWIGEQPGEFSVLDLPMSRQDHHLTRGWESEAMFAAIRHGHATPNGAKGAIIPWHDAIASHVNQPRADETDHFLRALGVRYVVARDSATLVAFSRIGLRPVHRSAQGGTVLEVDSPLGVPRTPADVQDRLFSDGHDRITRLSSGLKGRIQAPIEITVATGRIFTCTAVVTNTGHETWCASGLFYGFGPAGEVIVAARSFRGVNADAELHPRAPRGMPLPVAGPLAGDLAPGESCLISLGGLAPRRPGHYEIELDLLVKKITWFNSPDSPLAVMRLDVRND